MALPLTIDDFSTGPYQPAPFAPSSGLVEAFTPGAAILGGGRTTVVKNAVDPRGIPMEFAITSVGKLNLTIGVDQSVRADIGYGWGQNSVAPLGLDLIKLGAKAVRINFEAVHEGLDLIILLYTGTGHVEFASRKQPVAAGPFDAPLANFGAGGDLTTVSQILFILMAAGDIGINSFQIV